MHKRLATIVLSVAVLMILGLAAFWVIDQPAGKVLLEYMVGEAPQAKVSAFIGAVSRGDRHAALGLWGLPNLTDKDRLDALDARRRQVTLDLLAAGLDGSYEILHVEWWGTCCEPNVTRNPRDAGGARIQVRLKSRNGRPLQYTFDVFVRELPYWGAAEGHPFRHWVIRDIYQEGQEPYYWRFVSGPPTEFLEWNSSPSP